VTLEEVLTINFADIFKLIEYEKLPV